MEFPRKSLVTYLPYLFVLLLAGGLFFLYREFRHMQETIDDITVAPPVVPAVKKEESIVPIDGIVVGPKKQQWSRLQSELRDAVMQVFTQAVDFNWIEPYKAPNQGESAGTAFFINAEGDIITNAHVVSQAVSVTIQNPLAGKRRFHVDVIGVSPDRDLAFLRLKKGEAEALKKELSRDSFPYLKMGDSDTIQRGDKLMTLGYPLGQQGLKSTTGVVSGPENMAGQSFIQISAAINPGNSGGPSIDNVGNVMGVNSAGVSDAQNVGYIIPINEVLLFLDQLDKVPKVGNRPKLLKKPYLGVIFNNANDNLTRYLGNPLPGGYYVVDVYKGGPFDKAGIKAGDMVYKIDGYPLDNYGEMKTPWSTDERSSIVDYASRLKIGHTIRLDYYRKGEKKKASFKLELIEPPIRRWHPGYEEIDYELFGGFVIMQISLNHVILLAKYAPDLLRYADPKKSVEPALLITHVLLNSPAARARTVGAGSIIKEVNGEKVKTLDGLRIAALKSAKTGYFTIKTSENKFVVLPLSEVLEDEPRLSSTYFYKPSEMFNELQRLVSSNN